jgi:DNA primase
MKYKDEVIKELKDKAKIVQIINAYVPLKKAGKSFIAACPFHDEKTPSFHVSESKGLYHCFGCKKGGDVFSFVMEQEGVEFLEAVRIIAGKAGVVLPAAENDKEYQKALKIKRGYFDINKDATKHWHENLLANAGVMNYLNERGIGEQTVKNFELGYSIDNWDTLLTFLRRNGYTDEQIAGCGLLVEKNKDFYDRFRNRVIIPVKDVSGEIIAFGGRTLAAKGEVKYINSPETEIYTKGEHLFGLNYAKDAIKRRNFVVITEGYFDFISLYCGGIENCVATLGTSFTEEQAQLLAKHTDRAVVCFDGDSAGLRAAERTCEILSNNGFIVKVMVLPDGQDPDDFMRANDKKAFEAARGRSVTWIKFFIERLKAKFNLNVPTEKARAVNQISDILNKVTNMVERREYFDTAMRELKVDYSLTRTLWKTLERSQKVKLKEIMPAARFPAEIKLLELFFVSDTARRACLDQIGCLEFLKKNPLVGELLKFKGNFTGNDEISELFREYALKAETLTIGDIDAEVKSCFQSLERLELEQYLETLNSKMSASNAEGNLVVLEKQMQVLNRLRELSH